MHNPRVRSDLMKHILHFTISSGARTILRNSKLGHITEVAAKSGLILFALIPDAFLKPLAHQ